MIKVGTGLTILGMIATVIAFSFLNFESKAEANQLNAETQDRMKELKGDLKELRLEMNQKLDRLLKH